MTVDIALAHDPEVRRMIAEVQDHAGGRLPEEELASALAEFEALIAHADVIDLWRKRLVALSWNGAALVPNVAESRAR